MTEIETKCNKHVRLVKIAHHSDVEEAPRDLEAQDMLFHGSPWVDYEIKGYLQNEIIPGLKIVIKRYERNGKSFSGLFISSEVKAVRHVSETCTIVYTLNSVYQIKFL